MYKKLKEEALKTNLALVDYGLVIFTWGNVSVIDRQLNVIAIKPSGVDYDSMKADDMVVVDLEGNIMEGDLKPSSDLPTHLALYKASHAIGGVVHTHSEWATSWAQAGRDIPAYGSTHADHFYGPIPCTRKLSREEIEGDYEAETGKVIVERFRKLDFKSIPGVIVHGHGPFSWGPDAVKALENAVVMEQIAKMAFRNELLGNTEPIEQYLLDKHYLRKHGKDAYYGQK